MQIFLGYKFNELKYNVTQAKTLFKRDPRSK